MSQSTPLPFPNSEGSSGVYQPSTQELELEFAEQFTKLQGKFAYCQSVDDLQKQLSLLAVQRNWNKLFFNEDPELQKYLANSYAVDNQHKNLATCDASITLCECLVARTGTIVLSSVQASGRTVSVYAPIHICIAKTSQLVYDVKDALVMMKEKYAGKIPSLITFASGPSRTADIEKTLVTGVHGPKEVFCFLVD